MSTDSLALPSNREMLDRIIKNLQRAKGFVEVLNAEIDDPSKKGPGTDRSEWKREASHLQDLLGHLEEMLSDIQIEGEHE